MMKPIVNTLLLLSTLWSCYALSTPAEATPATEQGGAEAEKIVSLEQLLSEVRRQQQAEKQLNRQREQQFLAANKRQKTLLERARRDRSRISRRLVPNG